VVVLAGRAAGDGVVAEEVVSALEKTLLVHLTHLVQMCGRIS
jgi:hypothetical protein